ncbi:leucine-rich repeat domain-containing protein [Allocoprobacillus halotolerans]|uniref:Leucine-rich repeat domain-containing protein n=1 Tax=Allocoprobacillus halotolerans TaxID=2944914 RepID=A0ABY5I6X0_9FIRM|nr:leucine-rich repeat domain-containing protein [Allocoprobacillus halotolerans]UTY39690.1 leucine-rich repeat domain-containing protein [Allocoprobacillus halotolerans]
MKQKKWLAMLLAVMMVFTITPTTVFAVGNGEGDKTVPGWVDNNNGHPKYVEETFEFVEGNIAYSVVEGGVEVSSWYWSWYPHNCASHVDHVFAGSEYSNRGTMTIPASITHEGKKYKVVGIGSGAFYNVSSTKVILPEGLEYLADRAFKQTNVTEIKIPSTVKRIGEDGLRSSFTQITFAENSQLEEIGNMAFRGYKGTSLVLPEGVKQIGGRVFEACTNLSSITIPAGAEFTATPIFGATYQQFSYKGEVVFAQGSKYRYIDGVLYDDDTAIEIREEQQNIVIPEGIKYINEGFRIYDTVQYTSIIESITLPDSLESIGKHAFRDCKALKEIVIPENVTEIGNGAFLSCTSLERAEIKGNVTELNATFSGCSSLTEVELTNTIKNIGSQTFSGCKSLTGITLPTDLETIGMKAFFKCTALTTVIIPDGVTTISDQVFGNCKSIKMLVLPGSVNTVGKQAFQGAFNPTSATCIMLSDNIPENFNENAFGTNGANRPNKDTFTLIVPAGAEKAYAANEQLKSFVTNPDGSIKDGISVGVEFPEATQFCPGETFEIKYIMPEGASEGIRFDSTPGMDFKYDWNKETTSYVVTLISGEGTIKATPEINTIKAGNIFKQSKEFTVGHSYSEWKQTKAPDCTNPGTEERICADCQNKEIREIPALGHGETELKNAKDATCIEEGYTGDKVCKVCGEVLEQGKVIPKLAHSYDEWKQTKAPDCTNPGTEERICADCQNKEIREIPALGHGETELKNAKDATCTEEGYTGDKVCKVCGEVLEQGKVIPKLAHSYKDGKCTVCGVADPNYKPTEPGDGDTNAPETSDSSNMTLWIALLFVSGTGLLGATVYNRKKK